MTATTALRAALVVVVLPCFVEVPVAFFPRVGTALVVAATVGRTPPILLQVGGSGFVKLQRAFDLVILSVLIID